MFSCELSTFGCSGYFFAAKNSFSLATSASASVPCALQASAMLSAVPWGQYRQNIPKDMKMGAVSRLMRRTSPMVVWVVIKGNASLSFQSAFLHKGRLINNIVPPLRRKCNKRCDRIFLSYNWGKMGNNVLLST